MKNGSTYWVFGYGSLIWRPDFSFISAQGAYLCGYHRSLCVYSHKYRGTPESPGLVFGLVPGGCCEGRAFEVAAEEWPTVLQILRDREGDVYNEVTQQVKLADGRQVQALAFVADPTHKQYAGRLDLSRQMDLVWDAHGETGSNRDYILNTLEHLSDLGIKDNYLICLGERLRKPKNCKTE